MRSKAQSQRTDTRTDQDNQHEQGESSIETPAESDEASDLEEPDFIDTDDARWDVFLLDDDDCDPLPDYGDFWMPD